jgi:hypothetical protein
MRVIICGSRDWPDDERVKQEICGLVAQFGDVTIVHGDCPTGADAAARRWAVDRGAKEERHPAEWGKHGKAAGPLRNEKMAMLGADLCLAFCNGYTRGTADMMRRANRVTRVRFLDYQNLAAGWRDYDEGAPMSQLGAFDGDSRQAGHAQGAAQREPRALPRPRG